MASTYTDILRLEKQADGENDSTWGAKANQVFEMIEDAIAGIAYISTTGGTTTLSTNNSSADEARMAILKISGALTSNATIIIPAQPKKYTIWNATSGSFTVTIRTSGGGGPALGAGQSEIYCSGTDTHVLSIPGGTVLAFFQAAAPVGWSQITTHNNKALRIVSGTGGGSGGSVAFTTAFASQAVSGSIGSTTLTSAQIPAHTHGIKLGAVDTTGSIWPADGDGPISNTGATEANTGGGGSHNHTFTGTAINLAVQYIDLILASKN